MNIKKLFYNISLGLCSLMLLVIISFTYRYLNQKKYWRGNIINSGYGHQDNYSFRFNPKILVKKIKLSFDNNYLIIGNKKQVKIFNIKEKKFHYLLDIKNITDIAYIDKNKFIFIKNSRLFIFENKKISIIFKHLNNCKKIYAINSNIVFLLHKNALYKLYVNKKKIENCQHINKRNHKIIDFALTNDQKIVYQTNNYLYFNKSLSYLLKNGKIKHWQIFNKEVVIYYTSKNKSYIKILSFNNSSLKEKNISKMNSFNFYSCQLKMDSNNNKLLFIDPQKNIPFIEYNVSGELILANNEILITKNRNIINTIHPLKIFFDTLKKNIYSYQEYKREEEVFKKDKILLKHYLVNKEIKEERYLELLKRSFKIKNDSLITYKKCKKNILKFYSLINNFLHQKIEKIDIKELNKLKRNLILITKKE